MDGRAALGRGGGGAGGNAGTDDGLALRDVAQGYLVALDNPLESRQLRTMSASCLLTRRNVAQRDTDIVVVIENDHVRKGGHVPTLRAIAAPSCVSSSRRCLLGSAHARRVSA